MTPVICIGAMHVDFVAQAAIPLYRGVDAPGRSERRPGGVALNVALALARLGRRSTMLGAIGRDTEGAWLIAEAAARGVDCGHVLRHDDPTDRYLAIETPDGALFAAVADCAGLERAGCALLRPLLAGPLGDAARPFAGRIVLDGNLSDAALDAFGAEPALGVARLAVVAASPAKAARLAATGNRGAIYANRLEAEAICARSLRDSAIAARALRDHGFAEAVVTDGAAAATHDGPEGAVTRRPPAVAPRSLTGAGDVFLAAHLVAIDAGHGPEPALDAALAAAARHITREAP